MSARMGDLVTGPGPWAPVASTGGPRLPGPFSWAIALCAAIVLCGAFTVRKAREAIRESRYEAAKTIREVQEMRTDFARACTEWSEYTAREARYIDGFGCVDRATGEVAVPQ